MGRVDLIAFTVAGDLSLLPLRIESHILPTGWGIGRGRQVGRHGHNGIHADVSLDDQMMAKRGEGDRHPLSKHSIYGPCSPTCAVCALCARSH